MTMRDHLVFITAMFAAATAGVAAYRPIAQRLRIVAVPNERTLHARPTPRGGGVVIALVFLIGLGVQYARGEVPDRWFAALFGGGVLVGGLGFVDDVVSLSTPTRLVFHLVAAIWAAIWVGRDLWGDHAVVAVIGWAVVVVGMIWMINLYNFMDGIDGMAASGGVFFTAVLAAVVERAGDGPTAVVFALLGAGCAGFLVFNWPPAKLFMGDVGSGFLGYVFGVLALITIGAGTISVWTWLIVLGYFVADTTTTLVIRIKRVPRFWGTHRSHAYQNLARIWDNHRRMTGLVLAIDVVWLLPLALASVRWPAVGPALAVIALAPLVAYAAWFGALRA